VEASFRGLLAEYQQVVASLEELPEETSYKGLEQFLPHLAASCVEEEA
jgi:hypothetical protein